MADPLADFRAFFAGDFQRLLESTEIPGMEGASWDRRAAYLLWCMGSHYETDAGHPWLAVLEGHIIPPADNDFGGLV